MEENEILKELRKLARREGYVIIPESYYQRIFNAVEQLRLDKESLIRQRDKWKAAAKAKVVKE